MDNTVLKNKLKEASKLYQGDIKITLQSANFTITELENAVTGLLSELKLIQTATNNKQVFNMAKDAIDRWS